MKGIDICIAFIFDYIQKLAPGPVEFFAHIAAILMALIACIGVLIAFVLLAIEVTVVVIEFHIVTLIAFVTIPFGILTQTSFLSERAIGYVASVGITLMALAIVVAIGSNIFNAYTVSTDPTIYEEVGLLCRRVVLLMLALKIPAVAGALISGGPQLNAGSAGGGRSRGRRRRRRRALAARLAGGAAVAAGAQGHLPRGRPQARTTAEEPRARRPLPARRRAQRTWPGRSGAVEPGRRFGPGAGLGRIGPAPCVELVSIQLVADGRRRRSRCGG